MGGDRGGGSCILTQSPLVKVLGLQVQDLASAAVDQRVPLWSVPCGLLPVPSVSTRRPCPPTHPAVLPAGYTFCDKHRYAEDHDCDFDHITQGRSVIQKQLPSMGRSVGRGVHRLDSQEEHH